MSDRVAELQKRLAQCEQELRASEARFRNIIERNADGIIIVDRAGLVRFANSAAGALWSCQAEELLDRPFGFPLVTGETTSIDLIQANGATLVVEMRVVTTEWEGKVAYLASLRDITKQKRAEEALRDSQNRLKTVLDFVQAGIVMIDIETRCIVDANPAALAMIGTSKEKVIGSICHQFICPAEQGRCPVCDLGQTVDNSERILLTAQGEAIPIIKNVVKFELGGRWYVLENFVSIAERKRVEEEVRQRNHELALLNRIIAASTASLRPEAVLEIACRELAQSFNLPRATASLFNQDKTTAVMVAEYRVDHLPTALPQTMPVNDNLAWLYLLSRKEPLVVDNPRPGPDQVTSILFVPLMAGGEVVGCLELGAVVPRPVRADEVKLAWSVADQVSGALIQAQLSQEHRRLSAAIEQTADSVVITDTNGSILYVNPAFERITGYKRTEVLGKNLRILKSGVQNAAFYQELWEIISVGGVWHGRFVNRKKDGTLYTVDATITPVRDENGAVVNYVGVERDITRELALEEQYRQAQKMEAVGLLAGGIAHDFNNLLTAINGFAELLYSQMGSENPLQEYPEKILKSGLRAADLVRQLLAFSRKQVIEPKVLNLNSVVTDMNKILQRVIGENIHMELKLAQNLWLVKAGLTQIEQVIVNLMVNARDAMPEGGTLTIETANVMMNDNHAVKHMEMQSGEYVALSVIDTGVGMSEKVKAHLFEPFFTTKEVGQGTGLGLATVFGIIKQSDGHLEVSSEEGWGTTFKVYLPRVEGTTTDHLAQPARIDMPYGSETILLVEDDPSVRDLARQVLQRQGYSVLEAQNGQEAMRLSGSQASHIHLLLTDVIMPGINGKTLAERLARTYPEVKILFMSGYADNVLVRSGILDTKIAFIQKPFSAAALAVKVREVLDAA